MKNSLHSDLQSNYSVYAERLVPNFPIGCKRILISDDYYSTFNEPHVSLETQTIEHISRKGIRTSDGRDFELDAIVLATGFRPFDVTSYLAIRGRDGLDLGDAWNERIESHRTMMVPGFPNFFLLLGPNSGLGHNSIILMIEAQVRYVLGCLELMRRRSSKTLDPLPESARSFNQRLQTALLGTVFSGSCNAWYTDDNGHNFTLWPWSTLRYWAELRQPREDEFELGR